MSKFVEIGAQSNSTALNVILFHGLHGDATTTWRHSKNDESCWPKWLSEDLDGVRVTSISYEAPFDFLNRGTMTITQRAANIATLLTTDQQLIEKPIMLIGHSLGGLIIKATILHLQKQSVSDPQCKKILDNIKSVLFVAVPNQGSKWANILFGVFFSKLTKSLTLKNPELISLNESYQNYVAGKKISHLVFYESKGQFLTNKVVDADSSNPMLDNTTPIPLDDDHKAIVKPSSRDSLLYRKIHTHLNSLISEISKNKRSFRKRISRHKDLFMDETKESPYLVLLCSPSPNVFRESKILSITEQIKSELTGNNFDVVMGEELGLQNTQIHSNNDHLANELNYIKKKCNAVIIVADSIGTFCELGLFSWHLANDKNFRNKGTDFIVLMDEVQKGVSAYVSDGPFAQISALGKADYIDLDNFDAKPIIDRLIARRTVLRTEQRGRPVGAGS